MRETDTRESIRSKGTKTKLDGEKISVIQTVERVWDIEGFPNYFFGHDKRLYRFDSRGRMKVNRRLVIGTTQGYVLRTKFFSLSQLRPLLRRHGEVDDTPLVP